MSLTNSPWLEIILLFPTRESLVSDIPASWGLAGTTTLFDVPSRQTTKAGWMDSFEAIPWLLNVYKLGLSHPTAPYNSPVWCCKNAASSHKYQGHQDANHFSPQAKIILSLISPLKGEYLRRVLEWLLSSIWEYCPSDWAIGDCDDM